LRPGGVRSNGQVTSQNAGPNPRPSNLTDLGYAAPAIGEENGRRDVFTVSLRVLARTPEARDLRLGASDGPGYALRRYATASASA
jgi:hypothetical protein